MASILAIDDNLDNLITLKAIIKDSLPDTVVFTAQDGKKGIGIAIAEDPDVILLDIVMPGMDGFQVCRNLKADERIRDIPVVFLTAIKAEKESRIKALESGGEAFLTKPIDTVELIAQIRAMAKIKAASIGKRDEQKRLKRLVAERTAELERSQAAMLNLLEDLQAENEVRKTTETALLKTKDYLDNLIAYANAPIIVWNPDFAITRFNQASQALTGMSESEALGQPLSILFPEAGRETLTKRITGSVGKRWETEEFPIVDRRSGEVRTVLWNSAYIFDRDGQSVEATIAHGIDITDRRQAEEALKASEASFRSLAENNSDYIMRFDRAYRHVYANERAIRASRKKPEEFIGKSHREMGFPDNLCALWESEINTVFKTGESRAIGFQWENADGPVYLDLRFSPEIGARGEIVNVLGVSRDITERKHMENELRKSEELFRSIVLNSNDITVLADAAGNVTYVSPQCETVLGYLSDRFIGQSLSDIIHPNDAEAYRKAMEEAIMNRKDLHDFDCRSIDASGAVRWLAHSAHTLIIEGNSIGTQHTMRDISDRKQTEEDLKRAIVENGVLFRELQHRAKNSFNMIDSMITLTSRGSDSPESKRILSDLTQRVRAISELYTMLYSTGSAHAVRLDDYCAKIATALVEPSEGITLETTMESFSLPVKAAAPIGLILTELMTNALKYAYPDGRRGAIAVSLKKTASGAVLEVHDDGIGLPADFDLLKISGTGLNLVQGLAEQIHGNFKITGSPAGTWGVIEFPLTRKSD